MVGTLNSQAGKVQTQEEMNWFSTASGDTNQPGQESVDALRIKLIFTGGGDVDQPGWEGASASINKLIFYQRWCF